MTKSTCSPTKAPSVWGRIARFPLSRMLIGLVVCGGVALGVNAALKELLAWGGVDDGWGRLIRSVLFVVCLLLVYGWLFRTLERRPVTELDLKELPGDGWRGGLLGVVCLTVPLAGLALLGAFQILSVAFRVPEMVAGFAAILAAAAFEEVLFRGVVFRIGEEWLGTHPALALSALFFGLAHLGSDVVSGLGIVSAAMGGLILALLFVLTRRLWLPIVFHAVWNGAQACCGITMSGLTDAFGGVGVFTSRLDGPDWLTGGPFGIEASVITLGVLTVLAAGLYHRSVRSGRILPAFWKR